MYFTKESAKLSREKQIQNMRGKEKANIQKLKNARKEKITDYFHMSSEKNNLEIARQAKKNKKQTHEINNLKRQFGKSTKKIENLQNLKKNGNYGNRSPTPQANNALLNEKLENSKKPPSRRRFSQRTIMIAMLLILISRPCYNLLRTFDIWPSYQSVEARLKTTYVVDTNRLVDLKFVHEIVDKYKEQNSIEGKIEAILATDAVSLTPEICVTQDGFVEGLLQKEQLKNDEMKILEHKFKNFEEFCKKKKDVTITDAFLYHVQPINASLRSFVCHISPSTQGKATDREIELLTNISKLLSEDKIKIIGFAFDGDNTYSKMHKEYFNSYKNLVQNNSNFNNFSTISARSIISDPLHILKRARYKILSGNVHSGIFKNSDILNLSILRETLDVPELVFSNQKFTKMQDFLPIHLFSFKSFISLINEKHIQWLTYIVPYVLLNTALSEKELTVLERRSFIEIAFYYSLFYYDESSNLKDVLPQRKYKNNHVQMYDHIITQEFCNTCFSILRIIDFFNGTIHLNRLGSNPVEHVFGLLRMKSRYKHSFDKMKKVFEEIDLHKQLLHDLGENQPIRGRKTYYGQPIFNIINGTKDIFEYSPRDIAYALHLINLLPIEKVNIDINDLKFVSENKNLIVKSFYSTMKVIYLRINPKERTNKLSSHEIHISTGKSISSRISDKKIVN